MATKLGKSRNKFVARLVDGEKEPCAFCKRTVDDEVTYGKLYAIGDIQCHYFCVLLSCCLVQKGSDEEGLFGFLYRDILAEVERSKKHRCSYCGHSGATLGCGVSQCRKQFHLPCGREHRAVSLYYGNYKSFCSLHAPKQKITADVASKVKQRVAIARKLNRSKNLEPPATCNNDPEEQELVCVICYEVVDELPSPNLFWPPCCAKDKWLHRSCLEVMALNAGMHYLKCPLCNDKETFYEAVVSQGYYVPDRDAAWELEQNAFADMYERPVVCEAAECRCPMGRKHDQESGDWDIQLCVLCGSGVHPYCHGSTEPRYVCPTCLPHAPVGEELEKLDQIPIPTPVSEPTPAQSGPPMPSRMSIRRTKGLPPIYRPSTSRIADSANRTNETSRTDSSREDLNLKPPRRHPAIDPAILKNIENKVKPGPLSKKMKAIDAILEELSKRNIINQCSPNKEWNSPKKSPDLNAVKDTTEDVTVYVIMEKENMETIDLDEDSRTKTDVDLNTDNLNQNTDEYIKGTGENISPKDKSKKVIEYTPKKITLNYNTKDNNKYNEDDENKDKKTNTNLEQINNTTPIKNYNTPKKSKTINISKDSSLEISENDQSINIDVVELDGSDDNKIKLTYPLNKTKCTLKINQNKEIFGKEVDIDIESFKSQYLNEVDKDFKCQFKHNHVESCNNKTSNILEDNKTRKLLTSLDFAVNATIKKETEKNISESDLVREESDNITKDLKRKLDSVDECEPKKLKRTKTKSKKKLKNKLKSKSKENRKEKKGKRNKTKKLKTNMTISDKDIKLKIKWKNEQFNLKIEKKKRVKKIKKIKTLNIIDESKLQQYVLKYPSNDKSPLKDVIKKPDHTITPLKRKYNFKSEKSPDNMKQMSIQNFFKVKNTDEQ